MAIAFKIERKSARSTGKFCPAGGFFLCFVSFFFGKERNEVGAPKARHPAQRDKSEASFREAE
jgi:hypothetical protein